MKASGQTRGMMHWTRCSRPFKRKEVSMYTKNPGWEWENAVSDATTGMIGITFVLLAAILLTITVVLLWEIARIYRARAFNASSPTARLLWIALAVFLALVVLAFAVVSSATPYIIAWSFLGFV